MDRRDLSLYAPYQCICCGGENHFRGDFYGLRGHTLLIYVCSLGHETGVYSMSEMDPYHEHHYRSLYDPFYALFGQREVS